MERRSKIVALGTLLAIVLVAGAWRFFAPGSERSTAASAANEQSEAAPAKATSPAPTPASDDTPKPLPPADAPFALVAEDLIARADAGDRSAACRVGIELMFCDLMQTGRTDDTLANLVREESSASAAGNLEKADQLARAQARLIARRAQCNLRPPTRHSRQAGAGTATTTAAAWTRAPGTRSSPWYRRRFSSRTPCCTATVRSAARAEPGAARRVTRVPGPGYHPRAFPGFGE